jgi:hypothetical protein
MDELSINNGHSISLQKIDTSNEQSKARGRDVTQVIADTSSPNNEILQSVSDPSNTSTLRPLKSIGKAVSKTFQDSLPIQSKHAIKGNWVGVFILMSLVGYSTTFALSYWYLTTKNCTIISTSIPALSNDQSALAKIANQPGTYACSSSVYATAIPISTDDNPQPEVTWWCCQVPGIDTYYINKNSFCHSFAADNVCNYNGKLNNCFGQGYTSPITVNLNYFQCTSTSVAVSASLNNALYSQMVVCCIYFFMRMVKKFKFGVFNYKNWIYFLSSERDTLVLLDTSHGMASSGRPVSGAIFSQSSNSEFNAV